MAFKKKAKKVIDTQAFNFGVVKSSLRNILVNKVSLDKELMNVFKVKSDWSDKTKEAYFNTVWHSVVFAKGTFYNSQFEWESKHFNNYINSLKEAIKNNAKEILPIAFPQELLDVIYKECDSPVSVAKSLLIKPKCYLRPNGIDSYELKTSLYKENIETEFSEHDTSVLVCESSAGIFATKSFQKGLFEVQDISSQQVIKQIDFSNVLSVADACAGYGSKTIQLSFINPTIKVTAFDIYQHKLDALNNRAKKAEIKNIKTSIINSEIVVKNKSAFDALLLDVPCSGSGVYRRNPDSKWRFEKTQMERLLSEQKNILENYESMLKPNGQLVYSTCSIFKSEGENQIKSFLEKHKNYSIIKELRIQPQDLNGDGFYIAVLRKLN